MAVFLLICGILVTVIAFAIFVAHSVQKYFIFPGFFVAQLERGDTLFNNLSTVFKPLYALYKKLFSFSQESDQVKINKTEKSINDIDHEFIYEEKNGSKNKLIYNFEPMNFNNKNIEISQESKPRVLAVFCNGNSDILPHQRAYYTIDKINQMLNDDKKITELLTINYPGYNTPTGHLLNKEDLLQSSYNIVENHIKIHSNNGKSYSDIIVFGNSIGTVVAPNIALKIANAFNSSVKLILFRPIASISKLVTERFFLLKYLLLDKFSFDNIALFKDNQDNKNKPKIFISVGTNDNTTPAKQGYFLKNQLANQGYTVELSEESTNHHTLEPSFRHAANFINSQ